MGALGIKVGQLIRSCTIGGSGEGGEQGEGGGGVPDREMEWVCLTFIFIAICHVLARVEIPT